MLLVFEENVFEAITELFHEAGVHVEGYGGIVESFTSLGYVVTLKGWWIDGHETDLTVCDRNEPGSFYGRLFDILRRHFAAGV